MYPHSMFISIPKKFYESICRFQKELYFCFHIYNQKTNNMEKNKTLVVISKDMAEDIMQYISFSAVGLTSDGKYTTYQYHVDSLLSMFDRLSKTDDCNIER